MRRLPAVPLAVRAGDKGGSADCNGNGVPDECDIAGGGSADVDENGIPDECMPVPLFVRGDTNADGGIDIADAISVLEYLFAATGAPACFDAADANDDGTIDLSDAVKIIAHLFGGTGALPDPFGGCGHDATDDRLTCDTFAPCAAR